MSDLLFFGFCLFMVSLFGYVAYELLTAIGALILNVIDLSN